MSSELVIDWHFHTEERGYALTLEPDLFGDLILTRHWWGRHNRRGNHKREFIPDATMALKRLEQELARRKAHGYRSSQPTRCSSELAALMAAAATAVPTPPPPPPSTLLPSPSPSPGPAPAPR